jgi:hypothetical protein
MTIVALRIAVSVVTAWAALQPATLLAQWFQHTAPGVPRTVDGRPRLDAPAPRTPDGYPDFSGVWLADNHLPCPPLIRDGNDCLEKIPLSRSTYNIAATLAGGLPYQPWAEALARKRTAENSADDPHAKCLPSNVPRNHTLPHYQKFIQIPGLLVMLSEFNASYRQIFLDDRALPIDPQPSWNGYSTARWEGDTLVVRTSGFRDDLWLDMAGNPMTSAATVIERITRPAFGRLEVAFTLDDPKAYTRPWTVTLQQALAADTELVDEICLEGLKPLHLPK